MNTSLLAWGILFSLFGMGFFMYGEKQKALVPLACGMVLMIYPYFVSNVIALVTIGIGLVALPYFLRN